MLNKARLIFDKARLIFNKCSLLRDRGWLSKWQGTGELQIRLNRRFCVTDDVEFQMCHKCVTDVSQQKLESIKLDNE